MTHPSLTLKRWHPLNLEANRLRGSTTVTFDAEPPGRTLLVDIDPRMAKRRNLVTLYRAAEVNGLLDSLFETNPRCRASHGTTGSPASPRWTPRR